MDGPPVEEGPAVPLGGEYLVLVGVVDHAVLHHAVMGQGHGDGAVLQATDEVGGAVDGVHDEHPARQGAGVLLLLLAEEEGPGDQRGQFSLQKALHRQIVLRHQVGGGALLVGLGPDVMGGEDDLPRLADDGNDLFQHICSFLCEKMWTRTIFFVTLSLRKQQEDPL